MTDFVHLHVASGFSMRYAASTPAALVERAVALGQPALALTDRDGLYGAVRFVQACTDAGIAPVLGVDLAVEPEAALGPPGADELLGPAAGHPRSGPGRRPRSQPVRGGAWVDDSRPRVTVLARGRAAGLAPGVGWARLCRLVTDTHLRGERGTPVSTGRLIAERARLGAGSDDGSALTVLLGPDSEMGRAVLQRRFDHARALLRRWRDRLPAGALVVELVCHGGPPGTVASVGHAARLWGLAREEGVPVVLTAAVRHADPAGAVTVDVLDAARRMVPLDPRHLDRVTSAGHLASAEQMAAVARQVADALGSTGSGESTGPVGGRGPVSPEGRARALLADTVALARHCEQDPRADLGIGSVHLPEPAVLGLADDADAQAVLAQRCRAAVGTRYAGAPDRQVQAAQDRLEEELQVIARLGYPTYFMTVATVCDLIRDLGVRVAARGSGAGSMVNYLLGISGVEPLRHGLLMERFCSPLRAQLPDIDVDVESARRTEIYERILERFGGDRVTCVSMRDTYRVRHAIRDVAATLGMPPAEIDAVAKAFPHIRARDARAAIRELPELRASGLAAPRLQLLFELVERLDGLPRHLALHPCGVVLSNQQLLDRTPVEASWLGFPMSQFDKDDVEALGLLKLDVLGVRMQSAMAHATAEVARVEQAEVDLDDRDQVPLDDPATFELIRSTRTLGCFQIESPGQRELVGKFGPETFEDLIIDISLFRPGPVKSDMVTPFLHARQGWRPPEYLHPTLVPALQDTHGVVVFHEQVLRIVSETTGVTLAQADEVRRALGSPEGQEEVERWWRPAARARGYSPADVDRIWSVLKAFASFGFCKAHAAAFALPTYQSAWLKAHHPAAFFAGVLTHDPGMYPKRLILDDARNFGVAVLGLDVNASADTYRVEVVEVAEVTASGPPVHGIRLSLADVKGISDDEVHRIIDGQPYASLADFWQRARVSRPVVERLAMAGGFDDLYGIRSFGSAGAAGEGLGRRGRITRRDLLLHVAELDRWSRATRPSARAARGRPRSAPPSVQEVAGRAAAQARGRRPGRGPQVGPTQLTLDLGDEPTLTATTGLPELTGPELVRAELDILGLDASAHVVDFYAPLLEALGVTRSARLLQQRNRAEVLVAGVKVATQTPPVRSGRRVVFLTLDDATGPVDATFFEDVQGPYAATVFHSWMLLVRGVVRRTGPRGISVRATGAWELSGLWDAWCRGGTEAALAALAEADALAQARAEEGLAVAEGDHAAVAGAAASRSTRPVMTRPDGHRVLVHASGFRQSPYADVAPAGDSVRFGRPPRKLWHASPGSSGQ
ncbi:MAG TPA: DNA polymerase III subunit alpha [Segeticoccus sp.]|uniref:DNA polymerase III subunit alpha n=1 Tax=Segeticoccus sp. TaxID=2706531 RepID=UPI002D802D96|nr:DNA polymerase III subunit alpha [Segeticoccus sp.]HET8600279.1 DNA polymerase III subunit alpha [Segeticoccus sp.]